MNHPNHLHLLCNFLIHTSIVTLSHYLGMLELEYLTLYWAVFDSGCLFNLSKSKIFHYCELGNSMGKPMGIQCSTYTHTHGGFYPWLHKYTLQNEPLFIQNSQELTELWTQQLSFSVLLITLSILNHFEWTKACFEACGWENLYPYLY